MKLKKLIVVVIAVVMAMALTISVSAVRFFLGDQPVIGTLVWSGTANENEVLTSTTKTDVSHFTLSAYVQGTYLNENGQGGGSKYDGPATKTSSSVNVSISVQNARWTTAYGTFSATYNGVTVSDDASHNWT